MNPIEIKQMNPIEIRLEKMMLRIWKNAAGEKHRLDGPAVEVIYDDGSYTNEYWINGQAPMNAVHFEYSNGVTFWTIGPYPYHKLIAGWDVDKIQKTQDWQVIVNAHNNFELFLTADVKRETIIFQTGNFKKIEVPKKWFVPSDKGTRPNFDDVEIIDYGHAVRLGDYEASVSAILDEILTTVQKMDKLIKFIDYKLGSIPHFPDRVENMSERELAIVDTVSFAVALAETSKRVLEDIKEEVINAERRD